MELNNFTDLSYMFYNCTSLMCLTDISNWNTRNVININFMLFNCLSLQNFPNLLKWDISNIKYQESIFNNISDIKLLEKVDLKNIENLNLSGTKLQNIKFLRNINRYKIIRKS